MTLGFKKEGVLRKHEYRDGEYVDKIFFGMLKAEFETLYAKNHEQQ